MLSLFGFIYKEYRKLKTKCRFSDGSVLLTFDDGPDSVYTDMVLDILKKKNVPAVFFMVSDKAAAHPEVVRRVLDEGHTICFHSKDHRKMRYIGYEESSRYYSSGMKELIRVTEGKACDRFRPPWGMLSPGYLKYLKDAGKKTVFWSAMAQDWRENSEPIEMLNKLIRRTSEGGLVCLHDSAEGTGGADGAPYRMIMMLEAYIDGTREAGRRFINLDEAVCRGLIE